MFLYATPCRKYRRDKHCKPNAATTHIFARDSAVNAYVFYDYTYVKSRLYTIINTYYYFMIIQHRIKQEPYESHINNKSYGAKVYAINSFPSKLGTKNLVQPPVSKIPIDPITPPRETIVVVLYEKSSFKGVMR